jgi:hypothetical protein
MSIQGRTSDIGLHSAWDDVHEALPALWRVGRTSYDAGPLGHDGFLGAFSVTARGPHPGRGKLPQSVTGTGEDENAALRDLVDRLTGVPKPDGNRMDELRRRLRLAYIEGAETWMRASLGRLMTADELAAVAARFPPLKATEP